MITVTRGRGSNRFLMNRYDDLTIYSLLEQHTGFELALSAWEANVLTANTNAAHLRQMEAPPPNGYSPSIRFQIASWYSPSSSAKQIVTLSISDYFMRGRGIEPPIPYGQRFFVPLYVTIADFSLWAGLCLDHILRLRPTPYSLYAFPT